MSIHRVQEHWPSDIPEKDTLVIVPPGTRLYITDSDPRDVISITAEECIGVVIDYKEYIEEEYDYSLDYIEVLVGDRIYNILRVSFEKDSYFNLQRVTNV